MTEMSSSWPAPVSSRWNRAQRMAQATTELATSLQNWPGAGRGSRVDTPALKVMPPVADSTWSVATRPDHGPVRP